MQTETITKPVWVSDYAGWTYRDAPGSSRIFGDIAYSAKGGYYANLTVFGTRERQGRASRELGTFATSGEAKAAVERAFVEAA